MRATIFFAFSIFLIFSVGADAQSSERISLFHPFVFAAPEPVLPADDTPEPSERYGAKDTHHYMLGTTSAPDLSGNFDTNIHGQYTYFIVDDFEIGIEAGIWAIFQDGETVGVSTSFLMRYHFYQAERWSAFSEAGIGIILTGDNVPNTGTSVSLMPRLGAGVTWQMFQDSPTRLITGLRWHHISNARISGEEKNPSRDAPGFYMGVLFEF